MPFGSLLVLKFCLLPFNYSTVFSSYFRRSQFIYRLPTFLLCFYYASILEIRRMLFLGVMGSPARGVRILKVGTGVIQTATITGRQTRGGPLSLPKPFPYKDKRMKWYNWITDDSLYKVSQENARIIAVEGPIGVGKSAFCKALAEEFDMFYLPQPNMDVFYVLPSGYDLRQHDHEVPELVRSYDHKNFCLCPTDIKAGIFQMRMLHLRFFQYVDAICHLLNTGQGVVMERTYFSDFVFMKAMLEQKYISKQVEEAYSFVRLNTSPVFMPPHLIIYLDIPVPVVQERIRARNYSYEQNSPALTSEYLTSLEKYWKQEYLREARENSEILIYDWTDGGDIEVVIDDIEKIDFDIMRSDEKFLRWWHRSKTWYKIRKQTTNNRRGYLNYLGYPSHRYEDLFIPGEIAMERNKIFKKLPECQYDVGYNPMMGDSILKILFSTKVLNHRRPRYYLEFIRYP